MEFAGATHRGRRSFAAFEIARFVVSRLRTTTGSMPCITTGSAASGPVLNPSQRLGHQFLGSRRPAFTREAPGRGNLLYTQALQLARQQDQEAAARTAFEACCKAHPDHTKVQLAWLCSATHASVSEHLRVSANAQMLSHRHGCLGLNLKSASRRTSKTGSRAVEKFFSKVFRSTGRVLR